MGKEICQTCKLSDYDFVCTWNHWNRCVCRSAGAGRYGDESWKKYSGVYSASTEVGGKYFSG